MPKGYRRKTTKKKTYKKRFRKPSPYNSVRMVQAFPKKLVFKHKYADVVNLTSTTGALATYVFKANGMYDPDYTGTGHQPYYFDQLTALYNTYTVIGSRIQVLGTPLTTLTGPMKFEVYRDGDTTALSSVPNMREFDQKNQYKIIAINNSSPCKLHHNWSLKKMHPGATITNAAYTGNSSNDPTDTDTFIVATQCMDGTSTETLKVSVMIEYIAVWWGRKDIAQS